MATATVTAPERLIRKTKSIAQLFATRVKQTPEREAFRYPVGTSWRSMTWRQSGERVRAIAAGLLSLGIAREDCCGILANTRVEWLLIDLGILSAGAATTTVYPASSGDECAFILSDSGSRIVFVEDGAQLKKLVGLRSAMPGVERVILIEGGVEAKDQAWVMSLADLEGVGAAYLQEHPSAVDDATSGIESTHLATLIYTSGTTGQPKGVRLLQECWAYTADAIEAIHLWHADDVGYLWLPMAHSFGKVLLAGQIASGSVCAIDGRVNKIIDNLAVVRPTIMAAVPRIFEKVYNRIIEQAKQGGIKQRVFEWALGVGKQVSKVRQLGKEPSGVLAVEWLVADRLVFSKVRARFGGRLRFFVSGSAPLSRDIAEFFHACGILILEGYGLTESSAGSVLNRLTRYSFGSVGLPMPGTELRLAPEDNEILLRSPGVMQGYHNQPEQTAEVLTPDGWLKTGDIGELDRKGFLRITDRKKDLIKMSGGKYVAPQLVESALKAACPYVSQVIVHGDGRNFVSALVTLVEEAMMKWARRQGLTKGYSELVKSEEATALITPFIAQANRKLSKWEHIKQFAILPKDLTIDDGELTPSLKVKRKVVEQKYRTVLDQMYSGSVSEL